MFLFNNLVSSSFKLKKEISGDETDKALLKEFEGMNLYSSSNSSISSNKKRLTVKVNHLNGKSNDLFDFAHKIHTIMSDINFRTIKPPLIDDSSHDNIFHSIIIWIITVEKITCNNYKFKEVVNYIKPVIEFIKEWKIIHSHSSIPLKDNIKDENTPIVKLFKLFKFVTNYNDFPASIIEESHNPNDESFQLISKNNHCDYDPERVQAITTFIVPYNQRRVAIEMSKIIGGYDQNDHSLKYVYDRMIKDLKLSKEEKSRLDFYSDNFVKNLIPFIENVSFFKGDLFWYNLKKLLFKWMIHQREKTPYFKDGVYIFGEASKDLESIDSIIGNKGGISIQTTFDLESSKFYYSDFGILLGFEVFENSHFFHFFIDSVKNFQNVIDINGANQIACCLLRINHFNGDFDSNIRLKYLILLYSPIKEMKICILKNNFYSNYSFNYFSNSSKELIAKKYFDNPIFNRSQYFKMAHISYENYLNKFSLKFFQTNGQRIKLVNDLEIYSFLKILDREGLLTWGMVMDLVGFRLANRSIGWNQEKFDNSVKYLKETLEFKELSQLDSYLEKLYS